MRYPAALLCLLLAGCAAENQPAAPAQEAAPAAADPAAPASLGLRPDGDTELQIDESKLSPEVKKIHDYIDEHFEEHVLNLQRWIQQPSISNTGEGIPESAQMVKGFWDELGCNAQVHEPGTTEWGSMSNPVVYAKCDEGAEHTLMIYWMYDTMPVTQPDLWKAPPFEGRIVEQAPNPKVMIGRGATNSKGGQMTQLNALRAIKAVAGKLPVNLIVVAEGDEERMSIGLRTFARANPDLLKGAHAMWRGGGGGGGGVSFGSSEGCVYIELTTSGAKWGRGPVYSDIHGGRKRAVDSPAWRHMRMVSKLIGEDTNTAIVDGFYDNMEPMTAEQIAALEERAKSVNLDAAAKSLGVARFISDDPYEYLRMAQYGMSFNLDGIWGGNMYGGGAGAILPNKITSKHNIRYVPNQDGIDIVNKVRAQIDKNGYPDVEMKIIGDVPWHKGEQYRYEPLIEAMLRTYPIFGITPRPPSPGQDTAAANLGDKGWTIEPLNTSGGYWPAYLFGGDHKLPIHGAGVGGGGGNAHAANEFFVVEASGNRYGMAGAEKYLVTMLYELAGLNRP